MDRGKAIGLALMIAGIAGAFGYYFYTSKKQDEAQPEMPINLSSTPKKESFTKSRQPTISSVPSINTPSRRPVSVSQNAIKNFAFR